MKLSLDDQLKLALACGYEGAWIFEDRMVRLPPPRKFENWRSFIPTAPDTLMRLMEKLSIGIKPMRYGYKAQHYILPHVIREKHTAEAEQITDAILECSMEVINDG